MGIRFGFGAVKTVGHGAADAITAEREAGPFRDIFDFCARIDPGECSKRVVENLIRAGAFDQTAAVELQPDGTFSLDIPYAVATNELVWFVEAEDFCGDELQIERTAVTEK